MCLSVRSLRISIPFIKYFQCSSFDKIIILDNLLSSSQSSLKSIMATNRYCIDLAKRGTAGCKNCNVKIDKGVVRIGKIIPNPFTDSGGEMKQWFHVKCIFEKLSRARATTKKIESTDDLEGWDDMEEEHKAEVLECLSNFSVSSTPKKTTPKKAQKVIAEESSQSGESSSQGAPSSLSKDDTFREFRKICNKLADEPKYLEKTAILRTFFTKGSEGDGFKGDLVLWIKLLLPAVEKRVYNLQSKQLVKLFSEIFYANHEEMVEDLDQGDVANTIAMFFENSSTFPPNSKSTLTLQEVDKYLDDLTVYTKEAEQIHLLKKVARRCTGNDLKMFVRFIKHDLRIGAGPKPVLDAIDPSAYEAFQASRNLKKIVNDVLRNKKKGGPEGTLTIQSDLMTPVLPMLATACKSVDMAFKKFPNGFFVEIKYDGERVQVHKKGSDFSYFSRSLKPVLPHKVSHFKDFIPKAFPHGNNLIIDSEILLVDKKGLPLPFGTLGAHKKTAFKDATVCLFVFDCLQFNDENLMKKPLYERRKILMENMTEIKNHIMFSEMKEITDKKELKDIINSVIDQGLEGLVIKDKMSIYEPGKRHWLKIKKDYLQAEDLKKGMLDSPDLVVLGAYYGTGKYGGLKSIFLMGCLDEYSGKWCTVTKVRGFTDDELNKLQDEIEMIKINKNPDLVPSWLKIKKPLVPDFIVKDIEKAPVWEILGTEFSKATAHTANGLSIRFPRVNRFRNDKTWKQSTTLAQLQNLYDNSKQTADIVGLKVIDNDEDEEEDEEENEDELNTSGKTESSTPEKRSSSSSPKSLKRPSKEKLSPPKKIKMESPNKSGKSSNSNSGSDIKMESPNKSGKSSNSNSGSDIKMESPNKSGKSSNSNSGSDVLPNVFSGVKLYIPSSVKDAEILQRYFISYDGILLKENELNEANIVISTNKGDRIPKNAEKVTVDWLWACIKLKKRLPTNLYKID